MQTESPDVSVIVATLNAEATIESALGSILGQRDVAMEVIIVDGLSGDGTWDIVRKHSDAIARCIREADQGIYSAWNKGIRAAVGRYVCFMGADDRFTESLALAKLVEAAADSCDLVSCRSRFRAEPSGEEIEFGSGWNWEALTRGMCVDNRGLLHRRGLFLEYGEFDESYAISGDYEFLLRCGPGMQVANVDQVLVAAGSSGISQKRYVMRIRERTRAQRRHRVLGVGEAWAGMVRDIAREFYHHTRRRLRHA